MSLVLAIMLIFSYILHFYRTEICFLLRVLFSNLHSNACIYFFLLHFSIYDWYHPDQTERSARKFLDEYPYEPLDHEAMFMVHPYGKGREDVKYVISCK